MATSRRFFNLGRERKGLQAAMSLSEATGRQSGSVTATRVELHVSPQLQLALARQRSLSWRGSSSAGVDTPGPPVFALRATVVLKVGPPHLGSAAATLVNRADRSGLRSPHQSVVANSSTAHSSAL